MNDFKADLHCHSTCSDGSLTPIELIHLAKQIELSAISITDHDTVEAYTTPIEPLCKELGIALLTGVEFSASLNATSIHILGYMIDPTNPDILAFCARHRERRRLRNLEILDLLKKKDLPITEEEVFEAAPETPTKKTRIIGRPHIAQAMLKKGYVTTVQEAFKKYIGEGRPCYAPGKPFSIEETIETIHRGKGVAIIAHPHLISNTSILPLLQEMPFDGIECYYGNFPSQSHKRWLKIADQKHWLKTGGSDFHGDAKPNISLGCSWIDQELFTALQKHQK